MRADYAEISLMGGREENQDRVAVAVSGEAALLVVVDGMGGHANGARAAEVTQQVFLDLFWRTPLPLFDPMGFLHLTMGSAHEAVVKLGAGIPIEHRPRATCAACIVQKGATWWAHVGDSRLYHIRGSSLVTRTRDHSHVELLLREGLITAEQAQVHPMRNFVECCLGGDPVLPDMTLAKRRGLEANDVLLLCTDGLWAGVRDTELASELGPAGVDLRPKLQELAERAVVRSGAGADNTTAAALRWMSEA